MRDATCWVCDGHVDGPDVENCEECKEPTCPSCRETSTDAQGEKHVLCNFCNEDLVGAGAS